MSKFLRDFILCMGCYFMAAAYGSIYLLLEYTQTVLLGTEINFGYFFAISGIITILLVGFSGIIAKRYGAHKVAAFGAVSCALGLFLLTLITTVGWIYYLVSIFIGFGWSFYYSASPMFSLSPAIKEGEKGKYISLISVCVVAGTATLPVLYDVLSEFLILKNIYQIAILFSTISAMVFFRLGKLFELKNDPSASISTEGVGFSILKTEALFPIIMVFLGACVFSTMMNFQTEYAINRAFNLSIFYLSYSLSVVLCRIFLGGILTSKNPLKPMPYLLCIMLAGLTVMIFNQSSSVLYFISAICLGTSYGLAYPLIKTYAVKVSKDNDRHNVLSLFTLSYFSGVYFYPMLASYILTHFGDVGYLFSLVMAVVVYLLVVLFRLPFSKQWFLADNQKNKISTERRV